MLRPHKSFYYKKCRHWPQHWKEQTHNGGSSFPLISMLWIPTVFLILLSLLLWLGSQEHGYEEKITLRSRFANYHQFLINALILGHSPKVKSFPMIRPRIAFIFLLHSMSTNAEHFLLFLLLLVLSSGLECKKKTRN